MDAALDLAEGRAAALRHFRWIDGDADTWWMLRDAAALNAVVRGLSVLAARDRPDLIVGIEARGFALAPRGRDVTRRRVLSRPEGSSALPG